MNRSMQDSWITGVTSSNRLEGVNTFYTYSVLSNNDIMHAALITNPTKNSSSGNSHEYAYQMYWLATRFQKITDTRSSFLVGIIRGGRLLGNTMHDANSEEAYEGSWEYRARPFVEISLSDIAVGKHGDGSYESPYSVAIK